MLKPHRLARIAIASMALAQSLAITFSCTAAESNGPRLVAQLRRPTALVPLGDRLLTCNSRSGTISVIDTKSSRVVAEHSVAERISHIAPHPGGAAAFALDDVKHRLLAIKLAEDGVGVEPVADVARFPVRIAVSKRLHTVFVSSRWSRRITIVDFDAHFAQPIRTRQIELAFPPQELLLIDDDAKLIAADAFGGYLAIIDTTAAQVEHVRNLPMHNIRGLALSLDGSTLLVSHQSLDQNTWADRDDVHWGILMSNSLRGIKLKWLFDPAHDPYQESWLEQLGLVGRAAGDPGPIWINSRGWQAVTLSGVGEVSIDGPSYAQTISVGRRPSAMAAIDDRLFVANQFDDSISVVDLQSGAVKETIALGPPARPSARDRGELLFFDARLSHDRWMSCHSCHSEGHTTGLLADTLGDGGYGAPKRIPSLLGTKAAGPWSWNGGTTSLAEQVQKSVRTTMHGSALTDDQARDLVAFLESLEPPPSRFEKDAPLVRRGREVFESRGCVDCHRPPSFTSSDTYDVGLVDEAGLREFNPPSLRGLGQRDAFLHDGRASSVEEAVREHRHQLNGRLSDDDVAALIAFLKSL
jgi:YVTN family beta-propeller protein